MAINSQGELLSAYSDTCINYNPDKCKPTKAKSIKFGRIYECLNYDHGENVDQGCYWCKNKKGI